MLSLGKANAEGHMPEQAVLLTNRPMVPHWSSALVEISY